MHVWVLWACLMLMSEPNSIRERIIAGTHSVLPMMHTGV